MALNDDIYDFLDPILAAFEDNLTIRVQGYAVSAYLRGSTQMTSWGRTKLRDLPILYEGPPMQEAINYARAHTAKLVKGLNIETRDRLMQVISDAIKEKRGIDGLARDIRKEFEDMSRYRAEVIARTETADALEQSFMDRSKAMGITGKEWIVHDPCPICEEFGDLGVVEIDYTYVSSVSDVEVDRPPAHPNCRCALAPVILEV